jgi:hypothetical protein
MAKTAAKPSFTSILDQPASEIERPPALPRGYYVTIVTAYRDDKTTKTETPFTEFTLKVIEPWEKNGEIQVDEDELENFGEVRDSIISARYWHTEKSIYRLKEFLQHCGVDLSDGKSFKQAIPEAVNSQVIAFVVHEPWQTGEGISARVRSTAPLE